MKLWNDLSLVQKVVVGVAILLVAIVLPEIAILMQFGGVEIAFGLILVGLTPAVNGLKLQYKKAKHTLWLAARSLQQSAFAKPPVFAVQATFCVAALCFTGSLMFALSFFMPAMLFNGVLV